MVVALIESASTRFFPAHLHSFGQGAVIPGQNIPIANKIISVFESVTLKILRTRAAAPMDKPTAFKTTSTIALIFFLIFLFE
jgi:hypothetical protein